MDFVKMHGLGNDFVVLRGPFSPSPMLIEAMCDRRLGVGADGVLVVSPGPPVGMEYWNADGSAAEMCGNGLRCVARYAFDQGWSKGEGFEVDTPVGTQTVLRVASDDWQVGLGSVTIGDSFALAGRSWQSVSVGNPHAVTFVDDLATAPLAVVGPTVNGHFAGGSNVEFARIEAPDRIGLRVWERGVGETRACGTGAVATVAAAMTGGLGKSPSRVQLPGGVLEVSIDNGRATITGPAVYVFEGVWPDAG